MPPCSDYTLSQHQQCHGSHTQSLYNTKYGEYTRYLNSELHCMTHEHSVKGYTSAEEHSCSSLLQVIIIPLRPRPQDTIKMEGVPVPRANVKGGGI